MIQTSSIHLASNVEITSNLGLRSSSHRQSWSRLSVRPLILEELQASTNKGTCYAAPAILRHTLWEPVSFALNKFWENEKKGDPMSRADWLMKYGTRNVSSVTVCSRHALSATNQTGCCAPLLEAEHILLPSGQPSCLTCSSPSKEEEASASQPIGRFPRPKSYQSPSLHHAPLQSPMQTAMSRIAIEAKRSAMRDLEAAAVPSSIPALKGMSSCPNCSLQLGIAERGAVFGPDNSLWHRACLVCGQGRGKGCGKVLDATARSSNGLTFCLLCLVSSS